MYFFLNMCVYTYPIDIFWNDVIEVDTNFLVHNKL